MLESFKLAKVLTCHVEGCGGPVKPEIVFFGEALPDGFMDHFMTILQADLVLVIGTALAVSPFNSVIHMNKKAKKVLINRENTKPYYDFTKIP